MSHNYIAKFHLKQKIRIKDPGIIGHVMSIEFMCDSDPLYLIGLWDHNEFRTYRLDAWQLESFEERKAGVHTTKIGGGIIREVHPPSSDEDHASF